MEGGVTTFVPGWVPDGARRYLAHTEAGHSIRDLARTAGCHASTVMRQIRRIETRRDDPLVDGALAALASGYFGSAAHRNNGQTKQGQLEMTMTIPAQVEAPGRQDVEPRSGSRLASVVRNRSGSCGGRRHGQGCCRSGYRWDKRAHGRCGLRDCSGDGAKGLDHLHHAGAHQQIHNHGWWTHGPEPVAGGTGKQSKGRGRNRVCRGARDFCRCH